MIANSNLAGSPFSPRAGTEEIQRYPQQQNAGGYDQFVGRAYLFPLIPKKTQSH